MNNIILIGMMGSGKSTLSHELSKMTGFEIIDCDDLIEKKENLLIKEIFSLYGESHFRNLESNFLNDFNKNQCIVSTGGGMILSKENRERLKAMGTVFYMSGSLETLYNRLTEQTINRPLLDKEALHNQLEDLLTVRSTMYLEASDYEINIDSKTSSEVCTEIYTILRELDYKFLL